MTWIQNYGLFEDSIFFTGKFSHFSISFKKQSSFSLAAKLFCYAFACQCLSGTVTKFKMFSKALLNSKFLVSFVIHSETTAELALFLIAFLALNFLSLGVLLQVCKAATAMPFNKLTKKPKCFVCLCSSWKHVLQLLFSNWFFVSLCGVFCCREWNAEKSIKLQHVLFKVWNSKCGPSDVCDSMLKFQFKLWWFVQVWCSERQLLSQSDLVETSKIGLTVNSFSTMEASHAQLLTKIVRTLCLSQSETSCELQSACSECWPVTDCFQWL